MAVQDTKDGEKLFGVRDVAMEHWNKFGRNFFARYDYEEVDSDKAKAVMDMVSGIAPGSWHRACQERVGGSRLVAVEAL